MVNWVSPCLSFFFNAFTVAAYIFTAPTCKLTLISLEPCALNPEAQRQGDFTNNFSIYTLYIPKHLQRAYKCIWQIFTLALCKCKIYIYTLLGFWMFLWGLFFSFKKKRCFGRWGLTHRCPFEVGGCASGIWDCDSLFDQIFFFFFFIFPPYS